MLSLRLLKVDEAARETGGATALRGGSMNDCAPWSVFVVSRFRKPCSHPPVKVSTKGKENPEPASAVKPQHDCATVTFDVDAQDRRSTIILKGC